MIKLSHILEPGEQPLLRPKLGAEHLSFQPFPQRFYFLVQRGREKRRSIWRVLKWTGLIGVSLFSSALVGWFFLRDLSQSVLGFLIATGGGGMFYLIITDLVPEAEERHFQQSAGWAIGAGFITIFVLGQFF